jgi:3-phenylpropionate/trans-cinnamate dioxygenase ferredoxin reductase subunit
MTRTCIIVGAGHAAAQLAPALRQEGWPGRIVVVGEEEFLPYHRPPLSKALLAGEKTLEEITIRPARVYQKDNIEFLLNTRVEGIDRNNHQLLLEDGTELPYDRLALVTGSRVRRLELPGEALPGIHYLRTYRDAEQIKPRIRSGGRAVIIGGGYIGLETAAVLNRSGMEVTVIEVQERILARVAAMELSEFFTRLHGEEGVRIVCNTGVNGFTGTDRVERVLCGVGQVYAADLVIIGAGILPNVELAANAGLTVENGIVVDEYCRTSDPDIVAAGDCTSHHNKFYQRRLRLESVQNAADQARTAAATLCGKQLPYDALPWFWSDQYDVKLQMAGLSQGHDATVLRGDLGAGRSFAAFYFQAGRVIAVDAVNRPSEFMLGKKLITGRIDVDRTQLADDSIPMKVLMSQPGLGKPV